MRERRHRRSRMIGTSVAVVTALALGGGGIAIVASNASAGTDDPAASASQQPDPQQNAQQASQERPATIDCPEVADDLTNVPRKARPEVDDRLAQLDTQIAEAFRKIAAKGSTDRVWIKNAVLRPLNDKRRKILIRIEIVIDRVGEAPSDLEEKAPCEIKEGDVPAAAQPGGEPQASSGSTGASQAPPAGGGQAPPATGNGQAPVTGPARSDFVDIRQVKPNVSQPRRVSGASTGTFASRCGRNENRRFNSDNVIVGPGVANAAHHMHDYVGNQDTSALSTNDSLAAAKTTCTNGDKSTHYWPVLRVQNGEREADADQLGGGQEGNVGRILSPRSVSLTFRGSPAGKVVEMPRFLRIITGDAKSFTNGVANANASWSCTGFENRQLKDKYPLCPRGSQVVRTFKFQSCWDGQNIDSANHRTHVAFADQQGKCPQGFKAIPQLVQRITYSVPRNSIFAVDSFPEQLHKPVTDHGDFINVMSDSLMRKAVKCINTGRRCG